MQTALIKAAFLIAVYKYVPSQAAKAMALGVAGVIVAEYIPYLNGKDFSGKAV